MLVSSLRKPTRRSARTSFVLLACAAFVAGPGTPGAEPFPFETFVYEQLPAFGFCPALDGLFSAELRALGDSGSWLLSMSALEVVPREVGGDDCLEVLAPVDEEECVRERPLDRTVLSEARFAPLAELFRETWERRLEGPAPRCGAIDPCAIHAFRWDELSASTAPCDEVRLSGGDVAAILRALEDLRPPEEMFENGDTNGDRQRDLSDAVYLLTHLFLGGAAPIATRCPDGLTCLPPRLIVLENGDTNGDGERDVSDAVSLLNWLLPSLRDAYPELGPVEAGLYAAAPFVGGAIGNWVAGWLVDRIYRGGRWLASRRVPAMIGFALAAAGVLAYVLADTPLVKTVWFTVAIFGADMTLSPSWSAAIDLGGRHAGVVSGTMNMAGNVGSFLTALAFPYLLEWTDSTRPFFVLAALLSIASALCWLRIRPDRPLAGEETRAGGTA